MNKIECIGRLTGEPEVRYTKDQKKVVSFTLASNNREEATYIKITTFGSTADIIEKHSHKGDLILIDGIIKNNNYEKDGVKHYEYEFIGNKVEFLSRATTSGERKKETNNNIPSDEAFIEFGKSIEIQDSEVAF